LLKISKCFVKIFEKWRPENRGGEGESEVLKIKTGKRRPEEYGCFRQRVKGNIEIFSVGLCSTRCFSETFLW
jgi:hypothetical protein